MIFFSPNLLKLFQYYPEIQSIFILSPSYFHLISIHSPFIVRLLFVFCSFFVRSLFICPCDSHRFLFVHCSLQTHCRATVDPLQSHCRATERPLIVRLLFVHCSSFVRLTFPLQHSLSLGEGWGEDILFVLCSFARAARTVFCSSQLPIIFNFQSYSLLLKTFHTSFLIY